MNEQDSEINSYHSTKSSIYGGSSSSNVNSQYPLSDNANSNSPMIVDDDDEENNEPEVELMDDEDDDDDDDDDDEEEDEEDEEAKLDDDLLNNNKKLLASKNLNLDFTASAADSERAPGTAEADAVEGSAISPEEYERHRFQSELEFVQSLANPNYLNFLAQRGYFRNQSFINYLKYLMYWKEPEYVKYITYPQCLSLLEMLQHETFLKEIVKAECSKYIDEQLLMIWFHYKRARDWIKADPTKLPDNLEYLLKTGPSAGGVGNGVDEAAATTAEIKSEAKMPGSPLPTSSSGASSASQSPISSPHAEEFRRESSAISELFSAQSLIALEKY